ncbi:MAG: redox-regulated ATPase YchF [Planctomycetota bacterium]|jgi:GTP-binding protein YchF
MALSVGIIGLPNVGKSTLLNALTQAGVEASNYPFCTKDKNVAIAEVPDEDLLRLDEILSPEEAIPTAIHLIDIAGLVEGASKGEGLGNKFLGHVREADALLHVVRCFENENVTHISAVPDPVRDVGIVENELLLADLKTAESCLEKSERAFRGGHKEHEPEVKVFKRCEEILKSGKPLLDEDFSEDEARILEQPQFLTVKPALYLANVDESDPRGEGAMPKALIEAKGKECVIPLAVKIEEEISELPEEEGSAFLEDLGLEITGLHRVILGCYGLLGLITFYTIANNKLRAWQLQEGSTAPQAAGKVHSDMEKGFIRAEVMALKDLVELGSRSALQEKGLIHVVGKDYPVKDKDVLQFHFKA